MPPYPKIKIAQKVLSFEFSDLVLNNSVFLKKKKKEIPDKTRIIQKIWLKSFKASWKYQTFILTFDFYNSFNTFI